MLANVLSALSVGLLAAVAVDRGFGPGFIDDIVAYPAVVYACWIAAVACRLRASRSAAPRVWVLNLLSHAVVGALVLWTLRSILQFELPIGRFTTTGHYPYFALPVTCVSAQLVWELAGKRTMNRAPEVKA